MLREKALQTSLLQSRAARGWGAETPELQCPSEKEGSVPSCCPEMSCESVWLCYCAVIPRAERIPGPALLHPWAVGGDGESFTNTLHFPN